MRDRILVISKITTEETQRGRLLRTLIVSSFARGERDQTSNTRGVPPTKSDSSKSLCSSGGVKGWCSLLPLLQLLEVELELLAFKDVAVSSAGLSWSGRDASEKSTSGELIGNVLVDGSVGLSLLEGGKNVSALLLGFSGNSSALSSLLLLLLSKFNIVLLGIELLEGSGVDLDDGVLDDGLGSDELVVGGVVDHVQDSGLGGESLGSPNVVALIEAESSELVISTAAADRTDLLGAELSARGLSCHLKLPLLLMNRHATTS